MGNKNVRVILNSAICSIPIWAKKGFKLIKKIDIEKDDWAKTENVDLTNIYDSIKSSDPTYNPLLLAYSLAHQSQVEGWKMSPRYKRDKHSCNKLYEKCLTLTIEDKGVLNNNGNFYEAGMEKLAKLLNKMKEFEGYDAKEPFQDMIRTFDASELENEKTIEVTEFENIKIENDLVVLNNKYGKTLLEIPYGIGKEYEQIGCSNLFDKDAYNEQNFISKGDGIKNYYAYKKNEYFVVLTVFM